MKTLSKLSDKCKKCSHVDDCNNKRMVACAMAEMSQLNMANMTTPNMAPILQPVLRDTSMQAQMAEQIKKDFYNKLYSSLNCSKVSPLPK